MFRRYRFLTSFCVMFATLCCGAYGAASTRAGTTGRAGSLRTFGGGTSASVKANTLNGGVSSGTVATTSEESSAAETARLAHLAGLGGTKLSGKINLPAAASSQTIAELRQAIQQLRNDYDALGSQYSNLSSDVSTVSDTAQNARVAAANNTSTLTVVRSDLNDAKSDIEDLKTNGAFDSTRVQQAIDTTLETKNYVTQSDLATTDAVARSAMQPGDLPQKLTALNIADKDYVDAKVATGLNADQVLDIVGDSYYSKDQTNSVIIDATRNLVDKGYVNTQVGNLLNGYATQDYVDTAVATGMNEGQVRTIVGNVVNDTMGNYYNKGETDAAIIDATRNFVGKGYVDNSVNGLVSEDQLLNVINGLDIVTPTTVQNVVNESLTNLNYADQGYVDTQIQNNLNGLVTEDQLEAALDGIEVGVNAGDVQNIVNSYLENSNYVDQSYVDNSINGLVSEDQLQEALNGIDTGLTEGDVQNIVNSSLSGLNYADKGWVSDQISVGTNGLASYDYVDEQVNGIDLSPYLKVSDAEGTYLKSTDAATTYAPIAVQNKFGLMDNKSDVTTYVEGKLDDYATKEYVEANTPNVQIEQDTSTGDWYICKIADCTGQPFSNENAWSPFNANVDLTGYMLESDADDKYAEKSVQTAVEDSATGLEAAHTKIGTLPAGYSNVVSYVDQKVSEVSPEIQVKTVDGTTYICPTNDCENEPPSAGWEELSVDLTGYLTEDDADTKYASIDLETTVDNNSTSNPGLKQRVETLEDTIDDSTTGLAAAHTKIGTLPAGYSNVVSYVNQKVSEVSPEIQVKTVDGTTYICPTNDCEEDPPSEGWEELSVDLTGYLTEDDADTKYASIDLETTVAGHTTSIGNLGTAIDNDSTSNPGLKQRVETLEDTIDDSTTGLAAAHTKIGTLPAGYSNVVGYVDQKVSEVSPEIQVKTVDGTTYICPTNDCENEPPSEGWEELSVDLTGYLTEDDADIKYASIDLETTVDNDSTSNPGLKQRVDTLEDTIDDSTTGLAAAHTKIGTLPAGYSNVVGYVDATYVTQTDADNDYAAKDTETTASNAWDKVSNLGDGVTAKGYVDSKVGTLPEGKNVVTYVDDAVNGISRDVQVEQENGNTYICKTGNNCHTPVSDYPDEWAEITVSMQGYLLSSDAESTYLKKAGLTMVRDGADIKLKRIIDNEVKETIGKIASVSDLMCQSYRIDTKAVREDEIEYELVCITATTEGQ